GKQKFLYGSAQAAFEHDRFVELTDVREQLKVLHIARPDLQDIGVLTHNIQVARIKNFGDDRQPGHFSSMSQIIQTFRAQTLEAIGRGSRLLNAAPDKPAPAL